MNDDWKGEALIRAKPSAEDRAQDARRAYVAVCRKKRDKKAAATAKPRGKAGA